MNDIDVDAFDEERVTVTEKVERRASAAPATTSEPAEDVAGPLVAPDAAVVSSNGNGARPKVAEDASEAEETKPVPRWRAWVRPWMKPWLRSTRAVLPVFFGAGFAYVMASMYVWRLADPTRGVPAVHDLLKTWYRFDTVFYVRIAQDGYLYGKYAAAFYPLYPFLIKISDPILPGQGLVAGMTVSIFFALCTLAILHRMTEEEFGEQVASRTVFYLAAFPTGFFLFAAYNESLYIALALVSLYAARKGNFWIAGAAASLAGSTRIFGLLLAAPLAYEYMRQRGWNLRKIRWDVLSFGLIPTGVGAFAVFCRVVIGDWLAFTHAQDGWKRSYGWPGEPVWKSIKLLNESPLLENWRLLVIFELTCFLGSCLLIVLAMWGRWKFRPDQRYLIVYAAVPILLFSCTMAGWPDYLMSAPRIALEWFPIFIVLGLLGANRGFERMYLFMALMAQALMLAPILLQLQFVA